MVDTCMACGSGGPLLLTQAEPRLHSLGAIEALAPSGKQSPADLTENLITEVSIHFRSPIATIAALAAESHL